MADWDPKTEAGNTVELSAAEEKEVTQCTSVRAQVVGSFVTPVGWAMRSAACSWSLRAGGGRSDDPQGNKRAS
jgi:hypothetical protein